MDRDSLPSTCGRADLGPGAGHQEQRTSLSKRNTKIFYLLQHLLRCAECGTALRLPVED